MSRRSAEPPAPDEVPLSKRRRSRDRRITKEHILSKQNFVEGTDAFGVRIRIFTSTLMCQRARENGFSECTYDGDTIPSDLPDLRLPGKLRHGQGSIRDEAGNSYEG